MICPACSIGKTKVDKTKETHLEVGVHRIACTRRRRTCDHCNTRLWITEIFEADLKAIIHLANPRGKRPKTSRLYPRKGGHM